MSNQVCGRGKQQLAHEPRWRAQDSHGHAKRWGGRPQAADPDSSQPQAGEANTDDGCPICCFTLNLTRWIDDVFELLKSQTGRAAALLVRGYVDSQMGRPGDKCGYAIDEWFAARCAWRADNMDGPSRLQAVHNVSSS